MIINIKNITRHEVKAAGEGNGRNVVITSKMRSLVSLARQRIVIIPHFEYSKNITMYEGRELEKPAEGNGRNIVMIATKMRNLVRLSQH